MYTVVGVVAAGTCFLESPTDIQLPRQSFPPFSSSQLFLSFSLGKTSAVILQMAICHDLNVLTPALLPPNQLVNSNQMKQFPPREVPGLNNVRAC